MWMVTLLSVGWNAAIIQEWKAAIIQEKPQLVVATPPFPGEMPELIWRVVRSRTNNAPGPEEVVGEYKLFDQAVTLPDEGPFDVYVVPHGGLPVLLVRQLTLRRGQTTTLQLSDRLGIVRLFGEGLPQPRRLVITRPRDPGPGAKGHVPVQQVDRYRLNMLVPAGTYELWVVPQSGGRPQRVGANIRVLPGRVISVDD
jgi:hypothetical protein